MPKIRVYAEIIKPNHILDVPDEALAGLTDEERDEEIWDWVQSNIGELVSYGWEEEG